MVQIKIFIAIAAMCISLAASELVPEPPIAVADIPRTACSIAISGGLPEPQPLLIVPNTERFLEPQGSNGIIYMSLGESVELYCSGSFIAPFTNTKTLIANCISGNIFSVYGVNYAFNALACTGQVFHTARRTSRRCGLLAQQQLSEVGFEVGTRFLRIMDICHDEVTETSLYAHYVQTPANEGFQRSFPRPSFLTGNFFNSRNVDRLYTQVTQQETIGRTLGAARVAQLWDISKNIYLARGHLAAKADYIYGSQQRGTFYFINIAPQWQSFNGGNWENVESSVRAFVANRNIYSEIYTGTWGVLEMQDANGIYKPLYLDYDSSGRGLIPVPALYYKVVIDVYSQRGIVLIGVNNPHATAAEISSRYTICQDYSYLINWINWDRTNAQKGYSYACDVNDFIRTVNHLPLNVRTTGLLY